MANHAKWKTGAVARGSFRLLYCRTKQEVVNAKLGAFWRSTTSPLRTEH